MRVAKPRRKGRQTSDDLPNCSGGISITDSNDSTRQRNFVRTILERIPGLSLSEMDWLWNIAGNPGKIPLSVVRELRPDALVFGDADDQGTPYDPRTKAGDYRPPGDPDWQTFQHRLRQACRDALDEYMAGDQRSPVAFFAVYVEVENGRVQIGLDTQDNACRQSARVEQEALAVRRKILQKTHAGMGPRRVTLRPPIRLYSPDFAHFDHPNLIAFEMPEWPVWLKSEHYPVGHTMTDPIRIAIWHVFETLIKEDAFDVLEQARPFRIGFQVLGPHLSGRDESRLITLRLLNWPKAEDMRGAIAGG